MTCHCALQYASKYSALGFPIAKSGLKRRSLLSFALTSVFRTGLYCTECATVAVRGAPSQVESAARSAHFTVACDICHPAGIYSEDAKLEVIAAFEPCRSEYCFSASSYAYRLSLSIRLSGKNVVLKPLGFLNFPRTLLIHYSAFDIRYFFSFLVT